MIGLVAFPLTMIPFPPVHCMRLRKSLYLTLVLSVVGCASTTTRGSTPAPSVGDLVIPTKYVADRFFATPILRRGDTATFFLDTGGGTAVWDPYIPYLELKVTDSIVAASGAKSLLTPLPEFRSDASVPPAISQSAQGQRLVARPMDWRASNTFAAWIGRESQGQLGSVWFKDRVWTIDYPERRMILRSTTASASGPGREIPFRWPLDSAGRRVGQWGYVDVVIDGDTVSLIMDTGATIWLTADALRQINDGGPSGRAASHISNWLYARLHARHPDWPVIEHAEMWAGLGMIRVPNVSIAGYDVGPQWFSVLGGPATPPTATPGAPAWTARQAGTVGGSILRHFVVTLDYPRGVVRIHKP